MFSIILLCLNLALFLYILVYGVSFLLLPFIRPAKQSAKRQETAQVSDEAITVLIPCHHEGRSIINTVESVLEQDYPGPITAVILMNDRSDSSFEPLLEHFGFSWRAKDKTAEILRNENRTVLLSCCGFGPKREKLNFYLPKVETPYVAFLDADHRADLDWLSSSLADFPPEPFAGIQSRRAPLSLRKIPQLWDSAQNHIGNELVNSALSKVVGSVFFTGTTAVFRTASLSGHSFGDCVTEDTYLSYELLSEGKKIAYNSASGSREEVAPDIHSYIARRRRWSCGHNKAFFDLGKKIMRADVGWRAKAAVLIHGLFYTVPFAVCLLLNLYSLHLFVQYTWRIQALVAITALSLALPITLSVFGRHKSVIREILVLFFWIFPQLTLVSPIALYYADHDLYFFLTSFPYFRYIIWSHVFCLFAPVVLLLFGSLRIRLLRVHQLVLIGLSYPVFFFLDLWACLLGFSDFLFGRPTWAKIQRTHEEDKEQQREQLKIWQTLARWTLAAVVPALLVISFNDLAAEPNCGKPTGKWFSPTLFIPESDVRWKLREVKELVDSDTVKVTFRSHFTKKLGRNAKLVHLINEQRVAEVVGDGSSDYSFSYELPLGWESHEYEASLKLGETFCKRDKEFTSTHKELRDKQLYVNGEPFLVKGIIPSFSQTRTGVSIPQGLAQIKALGANTVRYYHSTRDEAKDAAEQEQLLIIDQPHRSTWDDVNMYNPAAAYGLQNRFEGLQREFQGFPYSLFHTLGNEIEIRNPNRVVPKLVKMMKRIIRSTRDNFFAYSTYFVFLKLPAAIYGVNMLDSSETYWTGGLQTIEAIDKPFYASEFGGFVASVESTPPELRAYRITEYWQRLLAAGAFGAVFHQSHDNYAQPVVDGLNDPFTPDHPDDLRGIWDVENKGKLIKRFVAELFSDFEFRVLEEVLPEDAKEFTLEVKNKRQYRINNITFLNDNKAVAEISRLEPGEVHSVRLPLPAGTAKLALRAEYSTHHGLSAKGIYEIALPRQMAEPVILNYQAIDIATSESSASGRLISGGELHFVLPSSWQQFSINGATTENTNSRISVPLRPSMEQATLLEASRDDVSWHGISPDEVADGPHRVRFRLPRVFPKGALLLLAGLGTEKYWIRFGETEWQEREAHKYRENIVPLDEFQYNTNDYFYLLLPRTETIFISKDDHPLGKQVPIKFEMPKVFAPAEFAIEKATRKAAG